MKKVLIILLNVIIIFAICTFLCFSIAAGDDGKITISGYVKTKNGEPIQNVTVTLSGIADSGVSKQESMKTDSSGKYTFENIEKGKYKVKFEYECKYINQEITLRDYEHYEGNVEVAYLYPDGTSIEQLKSIVDNIITNENNRTIKLERTYTDPQSLQNCIQELELDENNPNAFHKTSKYEGWRSIAIILTNYNNVDKYIEALRESKGEGNYTEYSYTIKETNVNPESIGTWLEEILNMSDSSEPVSLTNGADITHSYAETGEIRIEKNSEITLTMEEDITEWGDLALDDSKVLVEGNIYIGNDIASGQEVKATLRNTVTGDERSQKINNGEYSFRYPEEAGTYQIEFEINSGTLNGQNYEVVADYTSIANADNIGQNTAYEINRADLTNYFRNITFEKENQILETEKRRTKREYKTNSTNR